MPSQTEIQYNRKLQQIVKLVKADVDAEIVPVIKDAVSEYIQQDGYKEVYHPIVYSPTVNDGLPGIISDAYWSGNFMWKDAWSDVITAALQRLVVRWTSPFARQQAREIAGTFVQDASTRAMRQTVGIDLYGGDDQLYDYLKAAADQNAALITSIPAQYLEQVSNIVVGNMRSGMRPSYIEQTLVKQFGITSRRAKLIARDQSSKIQGEITRIRQVNSGIKYFRWLTAHDERVRPSHVAVGNRDVGYGKGVFSWSDLPVVDGVPTFPGQPINCRCVAVPVTAAQVERNKRSKG